MTETAVPTAAPPNKDVIERFVGILFSPKATFAAVAAHPTWLVMALVVILLTGGSQLWFQNTEVGRRATLDETVRRTESFGFKVSDQMYEQFRQSIMEPPTWRIALSAVMMVVMPPIIWAIMAGVLFGVFALGGGGASFRQVFAVLIHSTVVSTIGTLVLTPVNYFRESLSGSTNLAVLLPFLPEGSFLARLLGMVDVFVVWWVMVLAIGLAVVYKKKTQSVAIGLFAVYAVIAVGFAAFMAMRSAS